MKIKNPKLIRLFEKYDFSQKDIYDFTQIYNLLPNYKKVRAIENFEHIAISTKWHKAELLKEHEILFGKALESIEQRLYTSKVDALMDKSQKEMQLLKRSM